MSTIAEMKQRYDQMKAELKSEGQRLLHKNFSEFLRKYPEVECIKWAQYTPYFNDGEACVFRRHDFLASLTDSDNKDNYECDISVLAQSDIQDPSNVEKAKRWDFWPSLRELTSRERQLIEDYRALKTEVGCLPDEVYLDIFGDHVQVTATSTGFTVEEYEHD